MLSDLDLSVIGHRKAELIPIFKGCHWSKITLISYVIPNGEESTY